MPDDDPTFDDGSTVLLKAPPFSAPAAEACIDHLAGDDGTATRSLSVLFRTDPDERLATLDAHAREFGGVGVVDVGTTGPGSEDPYADTDRVTAVADPADLTGLGMAIDRCLRAWEGAPEVTVCVDSLSTLSQYAEEDRAFRFLHTVTGRLRQAGASAHCHVDPAALDAQTVARLEHLFDDAAAWTRASDPDPDPDPAAVQRSGGRPVATDGGRERPPAGREDRGRPEGE